MFLPVLERVDGRSTLQHGLRELTVVEADVAKDGLFEILAAAEAVALQDVLDPAIEALNHAVGLWMHGRGQAMFNTEVGTEAIEVVVSRGGPAAKAEQTIGELLAVACWE